MNSHDATPQAMPGAIESRKTYCRVCHASCALEVDVRDGRPVAVRGDRSDPIFRGYSCIKGRQLAGLYDHPDRITSPLKRKADGSFEPVSMEQALDEIATKIGELIETGGPRSVASYCGTYAHMESAALNVSRGWHQGIGSESYYTSLTIDQPGKMIAQSRFGTWAGGIAGFEEADVMLVIGCNPVVSHYAPLGGIPWANGARRYRDAIKRGATVICVDPRRTETARRAHYFLQVRPGEDPTLLAGMVRLILAEGLHDKAFCEQYVQGLDQLKAAIDDFTPEYVAGRTGIERQLFLDATRAFAAGTKGRAFTGTGPDMALHGNLTEHLVLTLNTILGRYAREGESTAYPAVLSPELWPRKAEVIPASPIFGTGARSRVRGLGQLLAEMPTAALADEILEAGEGQVKALLCMGGNPAAAWPDQYKTTRAMEALELLVCIDIRMSATSRLADYILPGTICLEREDASWILGLMCEEPYGHYTKALCKPNGELIEEWEFYWEIARRIGSEIPLSGGKLPLDRKPSKCEVLQLAQSGARVSLADLREHEGGKLFDEIQLTVQPASSDACAKFQLVPDGIVDEIREIRAEPLVTDGRPERDRVYSHLLISRRLRHVLNSPGLEQKAISKIGTTNPAYMNAADMQALGIQSGDIVEIASRYGKILGVAQATEELRGGVVSMAHAWGTVPGDDADIRKVGSNTSRLISTTEEYDPISGMARQSAVPVNVRAL